MLFYAITGLINAIGSIFVGLFVYSQNRKNEINKVFALLCLSIVIWSLPYFLWQMSTKASTALFWSRALMIGAIFIPITFYHFILVFLDLMKRRKVVLIFGYLLAITFLILDFTPLFVRDVSTALNFPYWPKAGKFYAPFLLMFFVYTVLGCFLLLKAHKKSEGIKKIQIKYLLAAAIFGFVGGATNYPLWYNISILPIGNALVILYPLLTAYAIIKHRLFNIRVIITELLVGVIAVTLLVQFFTAPTLTLKIASFVLLVLFIIVGSLLIQSVLREIEYREKLRVKNIELEEAKKHIERAYAIERQGHEELKRLEEARKQFILATQHHLRTPLTIMKGYVSMILEGSYGKVDPKTKKPLDYFQESTEKLIKLVNELLDISQFQMGRGILDLKDVQMEDVLQEIVNELKPEADKKGLYLILEKPQTSLTKIKADASRMKLALANVVDNGVKYTQKGGVAVKIFEDKEHIHLTVSDTGIGMEKEETEFLFGRFFERGDTAKKAHTTGRGIGLALSDQIIRAHKGRIWVESEGKDKGSTFHIEIPKSQTNNDQSKQIR